ncbi:MAG: 3-isopropylmalate dehydratase [Euryarchaeota archaeon RBG_16_68_13]|nr:MAG: 3-isopropylmalate dehydratase [Euryarchaeota archaeon RBG_16_68_13]
MQTKLEGRVWLFGEDISTDHIIAGKYLGSMDPAALAEHAMEAVDPGFSKNAKPGDIVVAATNFGCGSSREQAPVALQGLGLSCVIADSFARIFYRNAINIGFPVVECPGLRAKLREGDRVSVDLEAGRVTLPSGEHVSFRPLPPNLMEILRAGGLVPKLRSELGGSR